MQNGGETEKEEEYTIMLEKFINIMIKKDIDVSGLVKLLSTKYFEIKDEVLNRFSTEVLIKLERMLNEYNDIFNISPVIMDMLLKKIGG